MATLQDYLNMAVSLTIGNKSGTDNSVFLPDDFRKLSNLKVKRYTFRTINTAADASNANITSTYAGDSLCLVFFSHPVLITQVNGIVLEESGSAKPLYASVFCVGRNLTGSAGFQLGNTNPILKYSNTLASPGFTAVAGSSSDMLSLIHI